RPDLAGSALRHQRRGHVRDQQVGFRLQASGSWPEARSLEPGVQSPESRARSLDDVVKARERFQFAVLAIARPGKLLLHGVRVLGCDRFARMRSDADTRTAY